MKKGLIVLNGHFIDVRKIELQLINLVSELSFEYVIGVDGGCVLLEKLNQRPDLILGDFDSLKRLNDYKQLWPYAEVKMFQAEKDFTDAELAFAESDALELDEVYVIGGTGGRLDHQLSILFLLKNRPKYILVDEQNILSYIKAPYHHKVLSGDVKSKYVSLIPLESGFVGVDLIGFKYPLNQATISFGQTIGISNEVTDTFGSITILSGEGFLIFSED